MTRPRSLSVFTALALFAAIGLALRLWGEAGQPFWLDEAYSAYAADHDFAFLLHVVPRYETHPPLYYSLLHLWRLSFGDGLIALRLPGLIAGAVTVPTVAWVAGALVRLTDWGTERRRWLAIAAFALACVSIPLVEMSREVRPYPLMILVYAILTGLLLTMARDRRIGGRAYILYLVLLETMLWLHNLGPLYGVALTLALGCALLRPGLARRDWAWLTGGHALVALLYLPGLFILLGQAPAWQHSTWLRFALNATFVDRVQTLYSAPDWPGLFGLLGIALGIAALVRAKAGRAAAMLVLLAIVPVALSIGLSLAVTPVFIMRTMTPVAVPALLLLAAGAVGWSDAKRWLGLGGVVIVGMNMLAVDVQARQAGAPQDWYGAVAWLKAQVRPGDVILTYPNEGALPLAYALRDKGLPYPIRPIPTPVPTFDEPNGRYPTGSRGVVSLPREQLRQIAQAPATRAIPTIWLLRLGKETYDPGDMFLQELHRDRVIVRSWEHGPIELTGLRRR